MTSTSSDLPAALQEAITRRHVHDGTAHAIVSTELKIIHCSADFGRFLPENTAQIEGSLLTSLFAEFIGSEPYLRALLHNPDEHYAIKRVNRTARDDSVHYLDLELTGFDPQRPELGWLFTIRDTTEVGRLEQSLIQERNQLRLARRELALVNRELSRLDQLKTIFLSMAAHDIRAPLTVIRGYVEILTSMAEINPVDIDFDEFAAFLNTIRVQTDWLDNIINNILGLDQIENDQLVLHIVPCDLNSIIMDMCDMMQATAKLNQRTLTCSPADHSVIIPGDHQRLQQILQNVIGNGIKYNQTGGKVHISLSTSPEFAILTVTDNGVGIAQDQLPHIFELYYRTESAQKSQVRGTGLGLFIVKTLVEAHKGTIEVKSTIKSGTTFTICLPLLLKK